MMSKSDARLNDAFALAEAEQLDREGRREEARQIRVEIRERQQRDADRRESN